MPNDFAQGKTGQNTNSIYGPTIFSLQKCKTLIMSFRPVSYLEERNGKLNQHVTPREVDGYLPSKYNISGSPRMSRRRVRRGPVHFNGKPLTNSPLIFKPCPPSVKKLFKTVGRMEILLAKHKHKDIMKLNPGDQMLYTKHDHNFLVSTGFLGVVYNDNYPALRFCAYLQEEYKDLELKYEFEEALVVKALANCENWPALMKVVLVLVERLVIVDHSLVMVLPKIEEDDKLDESHGKYQRRGVHLAHQREEHEITDKDHPHIGTELYKRGKIKSSHKAGEGKLLFRGTRGPEKDVNLVFKVSEYKLGGVGHCFHFHIEEHLKQPPEKSWAPKQIDKKVRSFGFYYSTSILQNILSALEELGRRDMKSHLAKQLCKWIVVVDAKHSETGTDEIRFEMSRINLTDVTLNPNAPGDGQKALNSRLSVAKFKRPIFLANQSSGPPKMNFNLKNITASEQLAAKLQEPIQRPTHRLLTPDSIILHRQNQKAVPLSGDFLIRSGGLNYREFVTKRLKPVEQLAKVGIRAKRKYNSLEVAFYAGSDKYFSSHKPHFLRPTKQFLAQRHKQVLDKEGKQNLDKPFSKFSKLKGDADDTRPAVEIITPYQKGAVAAKILLTDPSEKKTRFKLSEKVGRSFTPIEMEFSIA
jgi:hypothetical protein